MPTPSTVDEYLAAPPKESRSVLERTPFGERILRSTSENPIPDSLVRKIVRVRLAEIETGRRR